MMIIRYWKICTCKFLYFSLFIYNFNWNELIDGYCIITIHFISFFVRSIRFSSSNILFHIISSFSSSLCCCRNRTSLATVRQIVPPDLFEYCETNHLLDDVVVIPKDDDDTESSPLQHPHQEHQPRTGPLSSPSPTPPPCTRHQEQQQPDSKQSITPLSSTTTQHSDSATTTVLSPRSLQEEKAAASPDKSASSSTMSQHHTRDLVFWTKIYNKKEQIYTARMQWKNKVTFTDEKRGRDRRITIETSQPNMQGNTNDYLDDDHKKAWKPIQKYI